MRLTVTESEGDPLLVLLFFFLFLSLLKKEKIGLASRHVYNNVFTYALVVTTFCAKIKKIKNKKKIIIHKRVVSGVVPPAFIP